MMIKRRNALEDSPDTATSGGGSGGHVRVSCVL